MLPVKKGVIPIAHPRSLSRIVSRACAAGCLSIGATGLVQSYAQTAWPPFAFGRGTAFQPFSAICVCLLGIALLGPSIVPIRISRVVALVVVIVTAVTFALYNLGTLSDADTYSVLSTVRYSLGPRPPSNSMLYLFLVGTALFLYFYSLSHSLQVSALSILGATATCIGAAGVFGYIARVEPAYAWGLSPGLSLYESLAAIIAGIGTVAKMWGTPPTTLQSLRDLWREITLYATLLVLFVALVSAAFAVLPFYAELLNVAEQRVLDLAGDRGGDVAQFLSRIRARTGKLSDLMSWRNLAGHGFQVLNSLDAQRILGGQFDDVVLGAARIDAGGNSTLQIGELFPKNFPPRPFSFQGSLSIDGPYSREGRDYLIARRPVESENSSGAQVDLFLISAAQLLNSLTVKPADGSLSLYLLKPEAEANVFYVVDPKSSRLTTFTIPLNNSSAMIKEIGENAEGFIGPLRKLDNPTFLAHASVPDSNLVIIAAGSAGALYSGLNLRLTKFLVLSLLFTLTGALGAFWLVRNLVRRAEQIQAEREAARRSREELVNTSLKEKEILLQEIHHRVKNNLQIISSMLRLQARSSDDPDLKLMLKASENRVTSIALLHQLLYRNRDLTPIDLHKYVQELCSSILKSFDAERRIAFHLDGAKVDVDLSTALPCGLLVNEIVTNSIKHAFPNGQHGTIYADIRNPKSDSIELIIGDDGIGAPGEQLNRSGKSLGLRLIQQLLMQLGASMERNIDHGTVYHIRFSTPGVFNGGNNGHQDSRS